MRGADGDLGERKTDGGDGRRQGGSGEGGWTALVHVIEVLV